ncbi:MAG: hypothetical protein ACXVCX_11145, partial [Ktedonobacterales bacterium]
PYLGAAPSMPLPPGQSGMPPAYSQPLYPNMQSAMPSVPMYGYGYGMPVPMVDPGAGQATTSLVLGIVGLVFSLGSFFSVCAFFAFVLGVMGIVFGVIGRRSTTRKGQATAGLIMSIIAVVLAVLIFGVIIIGTIAYSSSSINN